MRRTVTAFAALLVLASCSAQPSPVEPPSAAVPGWRELPGSPLSPRAMALGLWTGREALLIGGADQPCPPGADCAGDPSPLLAAAAVDPDSGRWRVLAEPPVALRWMQGAVVGGIAYVQGGTVGGEQALLAYDIAADRWERAALPASGVTLVAGGDLLFAVRGSEETTPGPDYRYAPSTRSWSELPADPLGAGFDRSMAWTGKHLVLFDHELVPNPGADGPPVTRAAVFDPRGGTWRRLPDSQQLATGPWLVEGGKLIAPALGGADGGSVGNWGRTYANGGVLDPATGTWSALPNAPGGWHASAFGTTSAVYADRPGPVLNAVTGQWGVIPPLPQDDVSDSTVVAAGNRLLVFGGASWPKEGKAELSSRAWLWTPQG
ncbi:hypothetical protein Cme02nite_64050 [Catellatospora methionotrophica]|uniref:Galactose oxidase n=1 Tax=Catellatospora methionotrophica TaxID=121620 RepID=A0A8J3LGT0_9ACTN|nr:hypothetical protein [Catellatospora methionotrophica]GIG18073.1 hypothetical protein Cme02nite_64050 [Catellatospora methionotrophica]